MNPASYRIVAYRPEYEAALTALERAAPQGGLVELELVKDRFLSRTTVFDRRCVRLALDASGDLAGVCSAAIVPIEVAGQRHDAGMFFDLKVAPAHRHQGIAKQLVLHLQQHCFRPRGIDHLFTTAKASQAVIRRMGLMFGRRMYRLPFAYLTIPTYQRFTRPVPSAPAPHFGVDLFDAAAVDPAYHETVAGWGIWQTHRMYQVRIRRISWWLRAALAVANRIRSTGRQFPRAGDILRFATLFGTEHGDPQSLNSVLEHLADNGTHQYLSICCSPDDPWYRPLRKRALFAYDYLLLTSLPVSAKTKLNLDVRCL